MAEIHNQRLGKDPMLKMNFLVEIDGIATTGFLKCEGLEREWGVAKFRNGDDPPRHRKQRTVEDIKDITLTEGFTTDQYELEEWYKSGERKSVSIVQLDHLRNEVKRWNLFECFPINYKPIEDLDSESEDINVRVLVLSCEDWE